MEGGRTVSRKVEWLEGDFCPGVGQSRLEKQTIIIVDVMIIQFLRTKSWLAWLKTFDIFHQKLSNTCVSFGLPIKHNWRNWIVSILGTPKSCTFWRKAGINRFCSSKLNFESQFYFSRCGYGNKYLFHSTHSICILT